MTAESARDFLNDRAKVHAAKRGTAPRTYTLADAAVLLRAGVALVTIVRSNTAASHTTILSDATPDTPRRTRQRPPARDRRPE